MIGTITINDQIGVYEKPDKTLGGITLLGVLGQFKALPQGTRIVNIEISSPGGLVDEGNDMYDYIESEKKNYARINTVQVGDIASIATKLFLVGENRVANAAFKFMIHNPWLDPGAGDSKYQAEMLEGLLMAESELRKFYSKQLNITEEGLAPLMDKETELSAEMLLTLGFATQLKRQNVMAMKKEGEKPVGLYARALALVKAAKGDKAAKALDVNLADGRLLSVDAPNEDSLLNAPAMLDGAPAPDGDYPTAPDADGMSDIITVAGGMVTAVTEQPAAIAPQAKAEERISNIEKVLATLTDAVSALVEANSPVSAAALVEAKATELKNEHKAEIKALRDEIGTTHTPKKASTVYASSVAKEETGFKSIAQRMREKEEARKANRK